MSLNGITRQIRAYLIRRYVTGAHRGVCLVCGDSQIGDVGEPMRISKDRFIRPMRCFKCNAAWNEVYIMQGVNGINLEHCPDRYVEAAHANYKDSVW